MIIKTSPETYTPVTLSLTFETKRELDEFTTLIGHTSYNTLEKCHEIYNALLRSGGKSA